MRNCLLSLALLWSHWIFAQIGVEERIETLESEIAERRLEIAAIQSQADSLKLVYISQSLESMGWPGTEGELVRHSALALSYNEEHELAEWVCHLILSDVAEGRTTRTNDFRQDQKISSGSAQEEDFFLKSQNDKGEWEYDGYGYDRGHLAPSADFRWNQKALSESYFYSNMTPQHPDFNRDSWAQLEGYIRNYAIENKVDLYVVTGPVLNGNLKKVERSVNKMSLPEYHYKVVFDEKGERAIGFLMPNKSCEKPLEAYARSVNEIEEITGLDFFSALNDSFEEKLEESTDYFPWLPQDQRGDAAMIRPEDLGKGRYNTLQAYDFIDTGKKVEICGTVVSTFKSKKNNVFINLDKKFPNTIFTLTIWSKNQANFSYPLEKDLLNLEVCARGEVSRREGVMQMNITNEKQIEVISLP
jgi:endonuclease G